MHRNARILAAVFTTAMVSQSSGLAQATPAQSKQAPMLTRDFEVKLALNGGPDHLRKDATVLVLGQDGFTRAKEGTNAFTCLVTRRSGDIFPICWDQEGARTLMPVDIDDAKWRLAGIPTAEIDRRIAEGFAQGRYRAPLRPGVAYMLSPIRYRIDEKGEITRTNPNPHVMAYAPYLTDADVGGKRGSFAFINKPGPDGMLILPVGKVERDAILAESKDLIAEFERQIGYKALE